MKNSSDTIGNRTRDLPTCSAVPQPTAPTRISCGKNVNFTLEQAVNAIGGGKWLMLFRGRFTPGNDPVPIVQEAGWAPGPVWKGAENSPLPGFDPQTAQAVTRRYTCYTIPAYFSR